MNRSRSCFSASSIGVSSVMRIASIAAAGACRPRVFFACCATISSNFAGLARIASSLSSRSRTRCSGRFSASTLRANVTAPGDQIALDDLVDQARRERVLRRDRIAGQDHRQRLLDADEPRQALRAARARDQAELDLGQAEPRAGRRDAEMAAQRELEPAAERRAVHRRDGRLRHLVERRDHVDQARRLRRLAELGDVGAGDEGASRAGRSRSLRRSRRRAPR